MALRRLLERQVATVVPQDLLRDRQAQPGTVFFPEAYEWIKYLLPHLVRYAGPIVGDANRYESVFACETDVNPSSIVRISRSLCGIEQQVIEGALQSLRVKGTLVGSG